MERKGEFPGRYLIIEERKEVWFVGSHTLALGMRGIIAKYFPGYKGCLASKDHFEHLQFEQKLKGEHGAH